MEGGETGIHKMERKGLLVDAPAPPSNAVSSKQSGAPALGTRLTVRGRDFKDPLPPARDSL